MKKTIIILSLLTLGGCATSGDKEELHHLLHISEKYAEKTPIVEDLKKRDFN
tara:strand:+ start:5190 stop:5345 length:156 start_codon:yes stop_codon:yes gene_type:complete